MTKIVGKLMGYPDGTPLKIVIREDIPYRSPEVGVSAGHYEGMWNGADWGVNVAMPRFDQLDAIPLSGVNVFISRTDTGAAVAKYNYTPQEWVETSVGVFDLSRATAARAWLRPQDITELSQQAKTWADQSAALSGQVQQQQHKVDNAITILGGIQQITVTPAYVELADVTGTRLTPSTHTTPNGYTLETITIEGV